MSRDEVQQEGIACYQLYIRALLDITDNRQRRRRGPAAAGGGQGRRGPYLVVAADKGTASFSDIANAISAEYDFWLGTPLPPAAAPVTTTRRWASPPAAPGCRCSAISARSASTCRADFTVVGIGDMAGDVFGNGMLLSEHIRLVAAFNHQHIFIDPSPTPPPVLPSASACSSCRAQAGATTRPPDGVRRRRGVLRAPPSRSRFPAEMKARFDIEADHLPPLN